MSNTHENMDRMYRLQRYFYDLSRKYYLLGRDQLLTEMKVLPGERVLDAGCGTARNLIILGKRHPEAKLFGLDASAAMLETAQAKVDTADVKNIQLRTALADDFTFDKIFDLIEPFDKIFFSYSISMIPSWRESIENALKNLKTGGQLFIVDFYDQNGLPAPFRRFLQRWLKLFHVEYPALLIPFLRELEQSGKIELELKELYRGYSLLVRSSKK